ncbi:hypothetical protein ACFYMB_31350 [Micromonospora haikouensis]|uniref:hypothetical protein n=1 Tax=Micromonospora haikouensis TaxID=686309 RepID=UPI00369FB9DF
MRDHNATFQPWVSMVDGIFTRDRDCGIIEDALCAHTVATALTAFHAGATFSGAAPVAPNTPATFGPCNGCRPAN